MPDDGPNLHDLHGRIEYLRGRQESQDARVDRLEIAINTKLGSVEGKLDLLASKLAERMEEFSEHIATVTARGGVATAVWGTLGGSCLLVAWEVIQFFVLKK